MPETVNGQRTYDGRARRARAERTREQILHAARELFLAQGYGPTTVAAIAARAGASAETIYKTFGGKAGLVRAIHGRSLLGEGAVGAEQRSDAAQAEAVEGRAVLERFGVFVAEVAPLVMPVMLLIRDAAAGGDTDMAALLADVEASRYQRMLHNARTLIDHDLLSPHRSSAQAADVMWAYTAPGLYEDLVIKRSWAAADYGRFIGNALVAALLE
ncbi:TetR family transcriptional regulator [Paenarthrobacter sp. Z7-10]|uniref:TetR family transcriptional regulator n=1 Tax=Paenarthrobacter sp. Z7-10 TaxID=2787635 RepID=UPI0022A9AD6B|nr:TetR family transcriptional regulator [Paenarthrobacter sp. Z7-10]MCZ2404649.1 TetR family transcriptional regulator [Paenarthrobacter sp. Z7-10]